ncbi:MAG: glycosyltransferase family 2 protein [Alphaproteobacteria bacterium]|nr:glycosyltransferase family 2 protein [Alphaproteobacteria bacterium]
MARPTVCLNMIVKDEAPVIAECLRSVKPLIDAWLICDTGSTDTTREVIRHELRGLPGEVVDRPWKHFGHNRSEALELARGRADYLLFLDADETLEVPEGYRWPRLTAEAYGLQKRRGGHLYQLPALVRADLPWRWEGVVHEYLTLGRTPRTEALPGVVIASERRGVRTRDPHTFRRDALLLEAALLDDPTDARSAFYLAQSYRDADDLDNAVRWYEHRATMGGWHEEVFVSALQAARCRQRRGDPWPEVLAALLLAHDVDPRRAEPLHDIGVRALEQKQHATGELFFGRAASLPMPPPHALFVEVEVYAWRAKLNHAVCLYWLGRKAEAAAINEALLAQAGLPDHARKLAEENLGYCRG